MMKELDKKIAEIKDELVTKEEIQHIRPLPIIS